MLLSVSHDLVKLSEESNDDKIIELAKMKEARSYYSLLARAAKDDIDKTSIENPDELVAKLKSSLKKNLKLLLRSPMSSTRKAVAIAFVLNYPLSKKMIKTIM